MGPPESPRQTPEAWAEEWQAEICWFGEVDGENCHDGSMGLVYSIYLWYIYLHLP